MTTVVDCRWLWPKILGIFILLFCPLLLFGQQVDYASIVNKKYAERHRFLYSQFYVNLELREDSVRFFNELERLEKAAKNSQDQELELEAEFIRYNFLSSRKYKPYLEEIFKFLNKVDDTNFTQLKARTRQAIALHYFYEQENLENAYVFMMDSYRFLNQLSPKELPDKQELLYNIAYLQYHVGYEIRALKILDEAQILTNDYYPHLPCNIINTKGLIYERNGNYKLAYENYKAALHYAQKINDQHWIAITKNNLAKIHYLNQEYDQALELIQKKLEKSSLKTYINDEDFLLLQVARSILLAKIYLKLENDIAFYKEVDFLENFKNNEKFSLEKRKDIYELLAQSANKKGIYHLAYFYQDSAMHFMEKINKAAHDLKLKQAIDKERIEELLVQKSQIEHQRKVNLITKISLSIIVLLLIVLFVFIYLRQHERHKHNRQVIEFELYKSQSQLAELLQDLKEKNKEVEAYEEELIKLHRSKSADGEFIKEKEDSIQNLIAKPLLTDSKWIVFKRAFDRLHPEFYQNLMKKIPNISQAEVRYVYLKKLNLSPKEITYILGVSQGSIRQYKHRIRNKLGFSVEDDLDNFIENI